MYTPSLQLRAQAELERRRRATQEAGELSRQWDKWLKALFSNLFTAPFADRHKEFWQWIESVELGAKPDPFFAIWGRGGAKTTNFEAGVVRLGAKEARKFCLYVRGTQDKSNESVQNISAMLEGVRFGHYYPQMASRKLGKYGHSKGWRVDTLRCANGFSVIGLGLDAAVRGIKIEEFRPDLIIFDDIDDAEDTPKAISKKINTITKSILPAGSNDVAVLGGQNLIHANSIFSKIADGTAEFLYNKIVSGPHPAVENLEVERQADGTYKIVGGEATWQGQNLEVCQNQINEWGLTSFLQEAQHEVDESGGVWDHIEFSHIDFDDVPDIVRGCVWCDPAVTNTDESDSHGVIADGMGEDGKIYRFYSWEGQTSPDDVLRRAILKAIELGFEVVGVETDQGGDVWRSAYLKVIRDLLDAKRIKEDDRVPTFREAKAGAGHGSKVHRNSLMLADYERGKMIHVNGTHKQLEKSLKRFPKKPLDLADAAYWGWDYLARRGIGFG